MLVVLMNASCTYECLICCNRYIIEARELPILSMFDRIKDQVMTRHYTKMKEASKFIGPICPKIQKKLSKHIEWSHDCYVEGAGDGLFKVAARFSSTPTDYVVDLKGFTCMRWAQSGIPCPHAISCMRSDNHDPLKCVDKCYSVEAHSEIAPLQLGDDVVQTPVMEAPQLRKKVNMFDELR
jgi:hypothetical protein